MKDTFNIIVELSRIQVREIDRVLADMESTEQESKESKGLVD